MCQGLNSLQRNHSTAAESFARHGKLQDEKKHREDATNMPVTCESLAFNAVGVMYANDFFLEHDR